MTVRELEACLSKVENKDLKVVMNSYYVSELNGYYYDKKDDENVLMLTPHNVQPRVVN